VATIGQGIRVSRSKSTVSIIIIPLYLMDKVFVQLQEATSLQADYTDRVPTMVAAETAYAILRQRFDSVHGGFGGIFFNVG
jgi:hypothetical protein